MLVATHNQARHNRTASCAGLAGVMSPMRGNNEY